MTDADSRLFIDEVSLERFDHWRERVQEDRVVHIKGFGDSPKSEEVAEQFPGRVALVPMDIPSDPLRLLGQVEIRRGWVPKFPKCSHPESFFKSVELETDPGNLILIAMGAY
ncbi:unnamed protein product [Durusdinium trenchii]|uniref:Uncharacterized protein n=1 Tax=Durusdinium trenchii TaxID=1381693 RepID=A0ABP0LDS3_9DINO